MNEYKKYLDKQLQNPAFASEWERQRPEREYIKAIIAALQWPLYSRLQTAWVKHSILNSDKDTFSLFPYTGTVTYRPVTKLKIPPDRHGRRLIPVFSG